MEVKQQNPISLLSTTRVHPQIQLYFNICHLKHLYRQGWLQHEVPPERCETVADHTFAVAFLAMELADALFPELDVEKVLRIALLHDLGEIDAGDLTPADGIPAKEKSRLERQAVSRVLGSDEHRRSYEQLWEEYESGSSPEAAFVHEVEKLEMALQALVYEKQGHADLDDFFRSAASALKDKRLKEILRSLEVLRLQ